MVKFEKTYFFFCSCLSPLALRCVQREEEVSAFWLYLFFIMILMQSWRLRQGTLCCFVGIFYFNGSQLFLCFKSPEAQIYTYILS